MPRWQGARTGWLKYEEKADEGGCEDRQEKGLGEGGWLRWSPVSVLVMDEALEPLRRTCEAWEVLPLGLAQWWGAAAATGLVQGLLRVLAGVAGSP